MHEQLFQYFRNYASTPLSEEDETLITNLFVAKKLRRKQYFLQEGEVCKYMAFVVKGAVRQYTALSATHHCFLSRHNKRNVEPDSL